VTMHWASGDICPNSAMRWADIALSASEDEGEEEQAAPTWSVEDSYREAPLAALEDSRSGLNKRLASEAGLDDGPTDFGFLGSEQALRERSPSAPRILGQWSNLEVCDLSPARPSTTSSGLNADAEEFIPTFSACSPWSVHAGQQVTPEKALGPRRRTRRKRRPVTPQGEKSGDSSLGRTDARMSVKTQEMPDASPEVWELRGIARQRAITVGKESREYKWFADHKRAADLTDVDSGDEPLTPNPLDRSVSKRQWKYQVQKWRVALKQWCFMDGFSNFESHLDEACTTTTEGDCAENMHAFTGDEHLSVV